MRGDQLSIGAESLDSLNEVSSPVRIVLLHDSKGKVLVILPGSHLLNLVVLWRESSRNLQPIPADNAVKFFNQEALSTSQGQRKLFTLPVYLDESCINMASLDVVEPHSGLAFELPRKWLEGRASVIKIGLSPEMILQQQPQGTDEEVIIKAVERFTALRIKQRMEETLELPSLPSITIKVTQLRADPLAGVDRLLPIVKVDPSLAAQVMSWAASPYYGTSRELQSIDDAVIRVLGYDLVVNLALGVAMSKTLAIPEDGPRGHTPYWTQAVYTATLTERLCRKMQGDDAPKPGLVYLTGLVHNFGYAILSHIFPPQFTLLSRYLEVNPDMCVEQVERHVLHVTREQVAAWLFDCWNLPKEVCMGVRHVNTPMHASANCHSQLVYIASRALRSVGFADGPAEKIDSQVLQAVGLLESEVIAERDAMLTRSDQLLELVQILGVRPKRNIKQKERV